MPNTEPDSVVHVAVGVILNAQQRILIALRHKDSHQGGLWEFPGGKVEAGETVQQALKRELHEELALEAAEQHMQPLLDITHHYSDKSVRLDVWWVRHSEGTARGMEGQPLRWVHATELTEYAFPEANRAIVDAVCEALN